MERKEAEGGVKSNPVRKEYIDFLKIIAIYMVLFIHTSTKGSLIFIQKPFAVQSYFYLFFGIIVKIAVPLFFMSSGALLLGKTETYKTVIKKRFLRFLVTLILASLINYLYICFRSSPSPFSLVAFIESMYKTPVSVALWYLYAFLAYILMLPLLRKMVRSLEGKDYKWIFAMYALIQFLSIAEYLIWHGKITHNGNFNLFVSLSYVFYPLMGYYIDQKMDDSAFTRKNVLILWILGILGTVLSCLMTYHKCIYINEWKTSSCQTFFNTFSFMPAFAAFFTAKYFFMKHKPGKRLSKVLKTLSSLTLGIFILEWICRRETEFIYKALEPHIHSFPACLIWIFCACVAGGVVVFIIKKIPVLRRYF